MNWVFKISAVALFLAWAHDFFIEDGEDAAMLIGFGVMCCIGADFHDFRKRVEKKLDLKESSAGDEVDES